MATAVLLNTQPPRTIVVQEDRGRLASEVKGGGVREWTELDGEKISVNTTQVVTLQDYDPGGLEPDLGEGPFPMT